MIKLWSKLKPTKNSLIIIIKPQTKNCLSGLTAPDHTNYTSWRS